MLLKETERVIHRDAEIASTFLDQAISLLAEDRTDKSFSPKNRGGLLRWQISRVDEYIKDHLEHCIRTTDLASLLNLSVSHFSHAFKHTTGVTPQKYVTGSRVQAARQQMLHSSLSLSEIALSNGFCDQSHFCRVFRLETGMSPQSWRKLHIARSQSSKFTEMLPRQAA
ncbi:AraC family transcriptional regulator [Methylophaga sp. TMB456]|nr:AraC family transcriptional regulator [Methylophaga pinxianii]